MWDPIGDKDSRTGLEHIRALAYGHEAGEPYGVRELAIEEIGCALRDADITCWVDVVRPGQGTSAMLRDAFGLSLLTIEDCTTPLLMPKLDELEDGNVFVAAFVLELTHWSEGPRLRASEVAMVARENCLITLHDRDVAKLEDRLQSELSADDGRARRAGPVLAHTALDTLVDVQLPVMIQTSILAEELEDRLDLKDERSSLSAMEALIVLRRDLLAFRRLAVAQSEIIRRLARVYPDVRAHFLDVSDNQREAIGMVDATCDYIDGAIEAYRLRRDERVEYGIRRLTILTGVLGGLAVIATLWGLNFSHTPGVDHPYGWWIFTVAQTFLALLALLILRTRGML
jgi:magnesium transporter